MLLFIFLKIFVIISVSQEYDQCVIIQQLPDIRPFIAAVSLCWWQQIINYNMTCVMMSKIKPKQCKSVTTQSHP